MSDEEFLKETARQLNVPTPQERPDLWALNWFGFRPTAVAAGFDFQGSVTADYSKNFQGGLSTRDDAFRNLLDLRLNIDTRALFGLRGGTFSIDLQNQSGQNGTDDLTGDVQGFDNADADGRTQISEVWYQQMLLKNRVRVKVGKVDANSEFAFPENGGDFINSSYGHSPTIVMPTYPDPSMSANIFIYPTRWFYVGGGVYDGSGAEGVLTGSYGPKHFFTGDDGYFFIGEVGGTWTLADNTLPGRAVVGGWRSTSDFDRFDGTRASGTGGVYAILEQKLWHKKFYDKTDPQGIAAFIQYGHADAEISEVENHYGAGLTWTGLFEGRRNDVVGVGVSYAQLSHDSADFDAHDEVAFETFYSLQATQYLSIKPDLQYILSPGGAEGDDALVATLRVTLAF